MPSKSSPASAQLETQALMKLFGVYMLSTPPDGTCSTAHNPSTSPGLCKEPCLACSNTACATVMFYDLVAEAAEVAIESYKTRTVFFPSFNIFLAGR